MLLALAGVKKWLAANEVIGLRSEKWATLDPPKRIKVESGRLPTREELRDLVRLGDLSDRVLITLAVSSGMRKGSLLKLKVKDIDLGLDIPLIRPPAETTKGRVTYFTFATSECKTAIMGYFDERRLNGEKITPESFVLASHYARGAALTPQGGRLKWRRLLKQTNLDQKGGKHTRLRFHVLRKFFRTYGALGGVGTDTLEFLIGHSASLRQTYFVGDAGTVAPEVLKLMETEYRKAVPALTIFGDEEKIRDLERLTEDKRRDLREKEGMIDELRRKNQEVNSRLDAIELELKQKRSATA